MAVLHRCWRLDLKAARDALSGLESLEDVLAHEVADHVQRVGDDPRRRELLVMARLDPSDADAWAADLSPSPADSGFERAAAARLSVLLASACADAHGLAAPPSFVEAYLAATGWSPDHADIVLRGRPISTLIETLAPRLTSVVADCRPWLVGGWLDNVRARESVDKLNDSSTAGEGSVDEAASILADRTGLGIDEIERSIRAGIADLRLMLTQPDEASALWIIQD